MRDQLVGLLLETADSMNIPIYWNHKLVSVDVDNREALFELDDTNQEHDKINRN